MPPLHLGTPAAENELIAMCTADHKRRTEGAVDCELGIAKNITWQKRLGRTPFDAEAPMDGYPKPIPCIR